MKKTYFDLPERIRKSFSEIDSDIVTELRASSAEYAELMQQVSDLKKRSPFIDKVLEDDGEITLSVVQHDELVHYLSLCTRMEELERLHIYFRGHTDAYAYLKRIGVLDR